MSINNYNDLSEMQTDVLKEIGNIGAGNAATALSEMLSCKVNMKVPSVFLAGFSEAIDYINKPETPVVGILIKLSGDIEGMLIFLLEEPFAKTISYELIGNSNFTLYNLTENDVSLLSEIGNIMGGSFISAVAKMASMTVDVSVPALTVDMLGAIMSVPAVEFAEVGDKLLLITEEFTIEEVRVKSNLLLIPNVPSLRRLMKNLGAENL